MYAYIICIYLPIVNVAFNCIELGWWYRGYRAGKLQIHYMLQEKK